MTKDPRSYPARHITLHQVATALNGHIVGREVRCPGPGHSKHDDSLAIALAPNALDGFVVYSHAGDDWRQCKEYVLEQLGLDEPLNGADPSHRRQPPALSGRDRTLRALAIWGESAPIGGTPAELYLHGRGVAYSGEELRWHPSCPFGRDRYGCMVALVRNIITNEPQAVHRTAIDPSGKKLSLLGSNGRLSLGPVGGGAVKLSEDADVTRVVAIGEGIETTLSIRALPDLGTMPIWSLLSARGIEAFPVLPGIETVWIAMDNDESGTGQRSAETTAQRLAGAGLEAILITTTKVGTDLNDKVARCG